MNKDETERETQNTEREYFDYLSSSKQITIQTDSYVRII